MKVSLPLGVALKLASVLKLQVTSSFVATAATKADSILIFNVPSCGRGAEENFTKGIFVCDHHTRTSRDNSGIRAITSVSNTPASGPDARRPEGEKRSEVASRALRPGSSDVIGIRADAARSTGWLDMR